MHLRRKRRWRTRLRLNLAVANAGVNTPFTYHIDDAATVYVQGNPDPSSPAVRQLEKTMASLNTVNPQTGVTESLLGTGLGVVCKGRLLIRWVRSCCI